MKTVLLRSCAILVACTGASANATGILDNYTVEWTKKIPTQEGSAVAYNWDLNRLMVTNDEETRQGSTSNYFATLGEYDMDGNFLATITVNGCQTFASQKCDPEGLTYIGGNNYVIGSERVQDMFKVTSATTSADRTYTDFGSAPRISIAGDAGNSGLEGIAFDKTTGDYYGVKETGLQAIYKVTGADWAAGTATVTTNFFDVSALGLLSLSDIAVLSNGGFSGGTANNLLILSGTSKVIMEVTKTGTLVGSYSLAAFTSTIDPTGAGGKFEGMTVDAAGNIYLVSDDGNGPDQSYMTKLKYNAPAVPEPATWALMIAGFGLVGAGIRRQKVAVRFA
jgi:uncharacterized protein YjiK